MHPWLREAEKVRVPLLLETAEVTSDEQVLAMEKVEEGDTLNTETVLGGAAEPGKDRERKEEE